MDPAAPMSRIEHAVTAIRTAILSNELHPGDPLVESELASVLGVSKTPVREALKILTSSGLVTFVPYKGARVSSVDRTFIDSVYGLRLVLEPMAVRLAVLSGDDFGEAVIALEESRDAQTLAEIGAANQRFHSALYRRCGNPLLVEVLDNLRDRTVFISTTGWRHEGRFPGDYEQHRAILDAVSSGDAEEVYQWLDEHIRGSHHRLVRLLGRLR